MRNLFHQELDSLLYLLNILLFHLHLFKNQAETKLTNIKQFQPIQYKIFKQLTFSSPITLFSLQILLTREDISFIFLSSMVIIMKQISINVREVFFSLFFTSQMIIVLLEYFNQLMFIPWPVYVWLIFSSAFVLYDFLYIYLRPLSFRFQPYEYTFEPYQIYQYFDTLKMNMNDRYLVIQNWLNLVQVTLILLSILLSWFPSKKLKFSSAIMLIVLSSFVLQKTVIYLWYDRAFITVSIHRMYSLGVVFYYCTIGLWIVFPLLTIYSISKRIISHLSKNQVQLQNLESK